MVYVTDTHPFLWYLADDKRLSSTARSIFDKAESGNEVIAVPTIVLAESMQILKKKRLSIQFKDIIRKIEVGLNYTPMSLDIGTIKAAENMTKLRELHDRIISATAKIIGCPLITKDRNIQGSKYIETVW